VDNDGAPWQLEIGGSKTLVMRAIKARIGEMIWEGASKHNCGNGLQNGADLTVAIKHMKYLRNRGQNAAAGLLQMICAGGIWTNKRKYDAGLKDNKRCPHCGKVGHDEYHLIWDCRRIEESTHPDIVRTQYLRSRVARCRTGQECIWFRGIIPKNWTNIPEKEVITMGKVENRDPYDHFLPIGHVYLDGSGGKYSNDPRIRQCGWAWIQQSVEGGPELATGHFGTLEGKQTVPRAEMQALIAFLQFCETLDTIGSIIIHTDAKIVLDGVNKGPKVKHGENGDLWEELWDVYQELVDKGWIYNILKVKAHTTHDDVISGKISKYDQDGNGIADNWAGKGADINQIPDAKYDEINWIDATVWLVQSRIIAICQEFLVHEKVVKDVKIPFRNNTYDIQIARLGHEIIAGHNKRNHKCGRCGQSWNDLTKKGFINCGTCPGPQIWGNLPNNYMDGPNKIPIGSSLIWAGRKIDKSHRLAYHRGIIYCVSCGHFSHTRVEALGAKCKLKPDSLQNERRLNSILQGKCPIPGKDWPRCDNSEAPEMCTLRAMAMR